LAVDFQSGHDTVAKLPDLLLYNSALFKRHNLPARTLLVLLHRGADSPQVTGLYKRGFPGEPFDAALRYRVVRVWRVPPQKWLSGGLGLVPLAPLGNVRQDELPAVIGGMKRRFDQEVPPRTAAELWSATYILMGLRYEQAMVQRLLQGVVTMKESVTYQAILEEGGVNATRKMVLLQGRSRFGEPSSEALAALDALTSVSRLEELGVRLLRASSWEELLGLNGRSGRGRGRKNTS
jgi:hypothetical protein